jgi:hypothetical protein
LTAEVDGVRYLNTGTWIEHPPCPFVAVMGNQVQLLEFPTVVEVEEASRLVVEEVESPPEPAVGRES